MSVQAIVLNTSGSTSAGNVSRVLLVSQAVTGPAGAAGDGATDLGYTAAPTAGTVTSSTGASATLPLADGTNAGLMAPAGFTKLAGIESGATADQSAAEILAALLTVDGAGSGLDADLLDGQSSAAFATAAQGAMADGAVPKAAGGVSIENLGAIESNVNTVAATGATETLQTDLYAVHDCTMDQACTFTFADPAPSGKNTTFILILRGAYTPTWPAAVKWSGGAPTYATPSLFVFTTVDAGTTWYGRLIGSGFA